MNNNCLIGKTLLHSISPAIHTLLNDPYYSLIEVEEESLKDFLSIKDFNGINVTIPYKTEVMQYLDVIDDEAKEINAVNTIKLVDGKYYGYNTDIVGFENSLLKDGIKLTDKIVVILGSGGASKVAQFVAKKQCAKEVIVVSRNGDVNYDNIYDIKNVQIIINATPVGMYPNVLDSIIDISKFDGIEYVFDFIYNPLNTKLILQAKEMGIKCSNGLYMLIEQARCAHNIFCDDKVKEKFTKDNYNKIKSEIENIVFIGMSGVGKSAIAEVLGTKLGKNVIDFDSVLSKDESIEDIFASKGEKYFRENEAKLVKVASMNMGNILVPGGGAIFFEDNLDRLKANGRFVLINRNLDEIVIEGRPLVKNKEDVSTLYEKRKETYSKCADIVVENNSTIKKAVDSILRSL